MEEIVRSSTFQAKHDYIFHIIDTDIFKRTVVNLYLNVGPALATTVS